MAESSLQKLKTQLHTTPVPFAKSRLVLYFCLLIFSLLSALLYLVSIFHELRSGYDRESYYSDHSLVAVAFIPLSWAATWSYIVIRTLLLAIDHNAPALAVSHPDPTTDTHQAGPTPPASRRSRLAPGSSKHRSSRCCCCTCTPWFPRETGPHPVFALCIDIILFCVLASIGVVFGILLSSVLDGPSPLSSESANWKNYLDSCPQHQHGTKDVYYYCTAAWRAQLAIDSFAGLFLLVCTLLSIATMVINGRLVHKWRGDMGLRRSQRGKRFNRTSGILEGDVENPTKSVEFPKMNTGDTEASK